MVLENLPHTRASRSRRQRATWPLITLLAIVVGVLGGVFLASH
jgi:hypothetical protein